MDYSPLDSYYITKLLGKGNFSVVKLGIHKATNMEVAIKIMNKTKMNRETLEKSYREINILKKLDHPNIAKLYQIIETNGWIFLVLELAPNGELFETLTRKGKMSEKDAQLKFKQILNVIEYCHQNNIVHRDLKAENILLDRFDNIKLVDFGFGTFYQSTSYLHTWCGSPPYAAPELFKGVPYFGPPTDIWSLGIILYVMVCGKLPYENTANLFNLREQVFSGWISIPFYLTYECESLIRTILNRDPQKRPTISKIRQHEWMEVESSVSCDSGYEEQFKDMSLSCSISSDGDSASLISEYNENVLSTMEKCGFNRNDIIQELNDKTFGSLTAHYNLLIEKMHHPHHHHHPHYHQSNIDNHDYHTNNNLVSKVSPLTVNNRLQAPIVEEISRPRSTTEEQYSVIHKNIPQPLPRQKTYSMSYYPNLNQQRLSVQYPCVFPQYCNTNSNIIQYNVVPANPNEKMLYASPCLTVPSTNIAPSTTAFVNNNQLQPNDDLFINCTDHTPLQYDQINLALIPSNGCNLQNIYEHPTRYIIHKNKSGLHQLESRSLTPHIEVIRNSESPNLCDGNR